MTIEITNAFMREMLGKTQVFTVCLLRMTDKYDPNAGQDSEQYRTIVEHGRRNFALRAEGKMPLVGPLLAPPLAGLSVFATTREEAQSLMEADPAVKAGYFTFELVPWRTFPGDGLPG